ncbi:MAG: HAD family hydrolase [Candidatus Helarchaeota archaeon]|nr:HAD family hydrolase [Candidatus Helarchaeota archaeon]
MSNNLFNKKLIIFDFDGTLVDFIINYVSLRSEVIEYLKSAFEFPIDFFSIQDRVLTTLNKAHTFILKKESSYNLKSISNDVDKIMRKWEWEAARKNKIDSNVKETLKILKNKGFKLAIFTLEPKEIIEFYLKKAKIEYLIDIIASRDIVKELKPNPEHINYILEKLKVKANQAIIIGDHVIDMECGKNIGALCIGKKSKLHTKEELLASGADFIISKISELNSLMKL